MRVLHNAARTVLQTLYLLALLFLIPWVVGTLLGLVWFAFQLGFRMVWPW